MLYREIIAVCSQIHTKHINTLCGQNVELLHVKLVVHRRYSDHWALKGKSKERVVFISSKSQTLGTCTKHRNQTKNCFFES